METLNYLFFSISLIFAVYAANAGEAKKGCTFSKLSIDSKIESEAQSKSGRFKIHYTPIHNTPQDDGSSLQIINTQNEKICESGSAIDNGLYISSKENWVIALWADNKTDEYMDLQQIEPCGKIEQYSGFDIKVGPTQIRLSPHCYPPDHHEKDRQCRAGQVFDIQDDCSLKLNELESKSWTKSKLGIDFKGLCKISGHGSSNTKIEECY